MFSLSLKRIDITGNLKFVHTLLCYINLVITSAVVDTTFVDIYVDTKNIPTCRYNIQHIDKRTMENKVSLIMWEAAVSYATTFK